MIRGAGVAGALLLTGLATPPLAGQGSPGSSLVFEFGPQGTLTIRDSLRFGVTAGPRIALRTLGGTRGSLALGAGVLGDSLSGRIEAAVEYQLAPRARGRPGIYFGGGLTGVAGAGSGGYPLFRFPFINSGPAGTLRLPQSFVSYCASHFNASGHIHPGATWHLQAWYRDPQGPCGGFFNTTNSYSITFGP